MSSEKNARPADLTFLEESYYDKDYERVNADMPGRLRNNNNGKQVVLMTNDEYVQLSGTLNPIAKAIKTKDSIKGSKDFT